MKNLNYKSYEKEYNDLVSKKQSVISEIKELSVNSCNSLIDDNNNCLLDNYHNKLKNLNLHLIELKITLLFIENANFISDENKSFLHLSYKRLINEDNILNSYIDGLIFGYKIEKNDFLSFILQRVIDSFTINYYLINFHHYYDNKNKKNAQDFLNKSNEVFNYSFNESLSFSHHKVNSIFKENDISNISEQKKYLFLSILTLFNIPFDLEKSNCSSNVILSLIYATDHITNKRISELFSENDLCLFYAKLSFYSLLFLNLKEF